MGASSINSISEFLLQAGTEYRIFDMGRRLTPIEAQAFLTIENGTVPAPYPRQQHGWFGIVFWNKNASKQYYIWFVKLPLDERGLVAPASRNHFLEIIVDALGQSIADEGQQHQSLPDNPYSFVPGQALLAQFNALVKITLTQPLSEQRCHVEAYLQAPQVANWQALPLQAVTDFAFGLPHSDKREKLERALIANISLFATPFLHSLMESCENCEISERLEDVFLNWVEQDDDVNISALRSVSCAYKRDAVYQRLASLLESKKADKVDILSVIAARHFTQFDARLLMLFFEACARVDVSDLHQGALFSGFFSDLVQIPALRNDVLAVLRNPERSDTLSKAIGLLFSTMRG
jgi:hypothetical protein